MGTKTRKGVSATLMSCGIAAGLSWAVAAAPGDPGSKLLSATLGMTKPSGDAALLFYLRPDLNIGPLGVGLDLTLTTDQDGLRLANPLADGVRYLSLGHKGVSPLYIRLGNIEKATLGTGILVDNYTNLTSEQFVRGQRQLGIDTSFNIPFIGAEYMARNAPVLNKDKTGLKAYRAYIKPLPMIRVGYSAATDDSVIENQPVQSQSVDAELYIGKSFIIPYVAAGRFTDKGNGEASGMGYTTGVRGDWNITGLRFIYKAEARLLDSDFVPGFFDFNYEESAASKAAAWVTLAEAVPGNRTIGLLGKAELHVPAVGLSVLGQLEGSKPFEGDAGAELKEIASKVVAEASLSDRLAIPLAGGKVGLGARYEGTLVQDSDSLGKLRAVATWKAPIGVTLSFINTYTYTKGTGPSKSFSVEGGLAF